MSRSLLLSLLFFLPLTGKSQTLLPLPQHFSKTKGSFSLSAAYNYVDKTGGEAKNIYIDNFARPSSNSKRAFVLRNAAVQQSPEAYKLHITKDSVVVEANSREGFLRAGQTLMQLKQKNSLQTCDVEDAPETFHAISIL